MSKKVMRVSPPLLGDVLHFNSGRIVHDGLLIIILSTIFIVRPPRLCISPFFASLSSTKAADRENNQEGRTNGATDHNPSNGAAR